MREEQKVFAGALSKRFTAAIPSLIHGAVQMLTAAVVVAADAFIGFAMLVEVRLIADSTTKSDESIASTKMSV